MHSDAEPVDPTRPLDVVQYWHEPAIPPDVVELLDSVRRFTRGSYQLFDREAADLFIGKHFSAREQNAFRSCAVPAMQADYFRYCALLVRGGAWVDADMLCVEDPSPLLCESFTEGLLFRRENRMVMNNFFLFRNAGSDFLRLIVDLATANIEQRVAQDVWLVTGPGLFTYLDLLNTAGSFETFLDQQKDEDNDIPKFAALMCRTAGSFSNVRDRFTRISISTEARLTPYVRSSPKPLAYKTTNVHWTRVQGSIYRDPPPSGTR